MARLDPVEAAQDAANRIRDQVIPSLRDQYAKLRRAQPSFSLDRLVGMPEDEATAFLEGQIEKYGEAEVERHVRRKASAAARKAGMQWS